MIKLNGGKSINNKSIFVITSVVLLLLLFVGAVSAQSDNATDSYDTSDVMTSDSNAQSTDSADSVVEKAKSNDIKKDTGKVTPEVIVKNKTAKTNTSVTLEAQLPEDASGQVLFKINGLTIGDAFRTNGGLVKYDYNIPIYSSKDYTINFVYGGNSKYEATRSEGILTLTKLNTHATIKLNRTSLAQGESVLFSVNIKNELKNGIQDAFVIKINGQSIGSNKTGSDGNGYLYYTIPSTYKINNYTVQLVYGDTNTALGKRVNTTLRVNNPTRITLNGIAKTQTSGVLKLKSKVVDKLRNNVTSGEVVYKINGITMGSSNVTNGISEFEYQLPLYSPRNYTITALYGGNRYYKPSNTNKTLNLIKMDSRLSAKNNTIVISADNKLNISLNDKFNKSIDNVNVSLVVNGEEVAKYPVINGVAIVNNTLRDVNSTQKVNALVVFEANRFYEKSTLTLKVVNPTKITVNAQDTKTTKLLYINATVLDSLNSNVTNGKVYFYLDNKLIGNTTVNNGAASTTYRLGLISGKSHNVTAKYIGDTYYQSSNSTKSVNILKLNTRITPVNVNITAGSYNKTAVKVLDELNNPVLTGILSLSVNNKHIGNFSVRNGTSNVTFISSNNDSNCVQNYSLQYVENNYYNASTATGILNIAPLATVYVSPNGNDNSLGTSKNPYRTISYATRHVKEAGIVYVNPGQYTESNININKSINIFGVNSSNVIITPSQSGFVFNNSNSTANMTIVNMTITNARINTVNTSAIVSRGPLVVLNCNFENNQANVNSSSSSIYATGYLAVSSSTFNKNTAKSNGGAITALGHRVIIINSKFTNNTVNANDVGGGAIYLNSANTTIESTIFTNNNVHGINVTGGAIKKVSGNLTLNRVNLAYNTLTGSGYNVGGALINLNGYLYIVNSTVNANNVSSSDNCGAGALYSQNSATTIASSTITNNYAVGKNVFGGALQNFNSYLSVSNTNFTYNTALATKGQAVGGAINQNNGSIKIINSRFHKNSVKANESYAAAIYFVGSNITVNQTQFNQNVANGTAIGGAGALFVNANSSITGCNFTSNQALGKSNGGGAIINAANMTANENNFISNVATASASAISNTGKNVNINNNYWGSSSPTWTKLIKGVTKPSKYYTKAL